MAQTATVKEITSDDDFSQHTSSLAPSTLLVVYFHAPWAAPCTQMSAVLNALAGTYTLESPPQISFLSINAEDLPDISEQYDVTAVPFIALQKGGNTVETISGGDAVKVRTTIEKYAGKSSGASKNELPPAQSVTRPAQENGSTTGGVAKNLSSYAPSADDPKTAPEFTGGDAPSKEELNTRLEGLVKAAPVMLFMKGTPSAPQCGFSRQTVSLLREKGIRYGFFNILADDDVRQGLKEYGDWPTYPQLWVDGELVGGLDIVREEFGNDTEFLKDYAVSTQRNAGGPAAPEAQAQPA